MSKDQDHRKTATYILATANKVVTTERGGQHGGAEDSFQMIADMWSVYLRNTKANFDVVVDVTITPKDVAQMMVLLKIARNTHGARKDDDFIDQAGYTALAAALDGIEAPRLAADVKPDASVVNLTPEPVKVPSVEDRTAAELAALKKANAEKRATTAIAEKFAPATAGDTPPAPLSPLERIVDTLDGETRN